LEERVKTLESDLQQTRTELGKKVQLVLQLENDLAQNQVPGTPSKPKQQFAHGSFSPAPNFMRAQLHQPLTRCATILPVDSDTDTATVDTSSSSSDTTMLNIVMAQRDRFKARIAQLEQENSVVLDQMKMLKGESHSLKEDNVKLYQKIKYLQSYREMNQGVRKFRVSRAISSKQQI
jgi:homeobox protein cut-like